MGWERLVRKMGRKASAGDSVTVALQSAKTRRGSVRICIIIGVAVSKRLGWAKGQRVAVSRGTGTDAGDLRIEPASPSDADTYLLSDTSARQAGAPVATRLAISGWDGVPDRAERARAVTIKIARPAGAPPTAPAILMVTLPLWASAAPAPSAERRPALNGGAPRA